MDYLFYMVCLGIIVALIARSKGRDPFGWFLYGALIFIVAIVHVLVISPRQEAVERKARDQGRVPCPHCREVILRGANICPHCRSDLATRQPTSPPETAGIATCGSCRRSIPSHLPRCPECGATRKAAQA